MDAASAPAGAAPLALHRIERGPRYLVMPDAIDGEASVAISSAAAWSWIAWR